MFADSSRGSDPALARDTLTSSPKGSPKQQRARSAVRLIDIKREASVDVASTSHALLTAPVVAVSEHIISKNPTQQQFYYKYQQFLNYRDWHFVAEIFIKK